MAGFDWNQFYTLFKSKMNGICTVGRYTIPKSPTYPYTDIALADNPSGDYDLLMNEGNQSPLIELNVYCNNYDNAKCYEVSMQAKAVMKSYGFQCKVGPRKIDNSDPGVARWVSRYQRVFGSGDILRKIN